MADETLEEAIGECVVHDHPVPPEMLRRYSTERDPTAEANIAEYVEWQCRGDEIVQHVERIKTEYVMGDDYELWDVTTDKDRWWVITNATNLYSQKHFPSLDYTLSFHVGLMMRMRSKGGGPDGDNPQPFDEVLRRHKQADELHTKAVEAVDYQGVGMQLRECLIALAAALRRRINSIPVENFPQASNFKAWNDLIMNVLAPGESNKELRHFMKSAGDRLWQLANWLTHDTNANKTVSAIALTSIDTYIGHSIMLLSRDQTDKKEACPVCTSRNLRRFFDAAIGEDGSYFLSCGECEWNDNPDQQPILDAV